MFVETTVAKGQTGSFEVYNAMGIMMSNRALQEGNNMLNINTASLSAGLYSYRITINGTVIKTDKFMLVH